MGLLSDIYTVPHEVYMEIVGHTCSGRASGSSNKYLYTLEWNHQHLARHAGGKLRREGEVKHPTSWAGERI